MLHEELMDMIMDHYENPRNFGKIDGSNVMQDGGNPGCGDTLTVYLRVDNKDIVRDISFEGTGCIVSQAATSIITEMVKNKSLEEVKKISSEKMKEILSKDLVIRRPHCANLGINTVKAALRKFEKQKTNESIDQKAI